jgi:hypothetical protein
LPSRGAPAPPSPSCWREALSTLRQGLARHRAYRSRVAEAGRMRALAHRVGRRDHRMAAEMLSAADRHELG